GGYTDAPRQPRPRVGHCQGAVLACGGDEPHSVLGDGAMDEEHVRLAEHAEDALDFLGGDRVADCLVQPHSILPGSAYWATWSHRSGWFMKWPQWRSRYSFSPLMCSCIAAAAPGAS